VQQRVVVVGADQLSTTQVSEVARAHAVRDNKRTDVGVVAGVLIALTTRAGGVVK
jgi:hypothetical protein